MRSAPSFIVVVIVCCLSISGCSHKKNVTDEPASSPSISESNTGSSDAGNAQGLVTVHFAYDSSLLDKAGKKVLRQDAKILKEKSSLKVQIEGHCDARGGIQYNIALGERRADSVRKYLKGLGVSADHMTIISYGKERPLDPADTEEAYAKNRRANFVITGHL